MTQSPMQSCSRYIHTDAPSSGSPEPSNRSVSYSPPFLPQEQAPEEQAQHKEFLA